MFAQLINETVILHVSQWFSKFILFTHLNRRIQDVLNLFCFVLITVEIGSFAAAGQAENSYKMSNCSWIAGFIEPVLQGMPPVLSKCNFKWLTHQDQQWLLLHTGLKHFVFAVQLTLASSLDQVHWDSLSNAPPPHSSKHLMPWAVLHFLYTFFIHSHTVFQENNLHTLLLTFCPTHFMSTL